MTVTEYAKSKGTGPRQARRIMERLGLLQPEIGFRSVPCRADLSQSKPEYRHSYRLAPWAVETGLGKRVEPRNRIAYDILSPDGITWLNVHWPSQEAVKANPVGRPVSSVRTDIKALIAAGKSQAEIARILGKSRSTVSHHVSALKVPA
ncbi:helix-turn-helix domain-containing protein [Nitratireductor aquimarinus]|uniref:helix-turn-helix domain-containing protein n=1 Tax=Nitratireductor aquimarinus TaxID=889300 RepID=UPI00293655E0|nr:helix-turn-helix domain-containing protein [Nitratireductor aquimarinus]MDV2966014.1 helix-turn-helix domain-containing protein [Nitratireductor aquimarinus]